MKILNEYQREEDYFSIRGYCFVILLLLLFLSLLVGIKIDHTLPVNLIRTEKGEYQTYLTVDHLDSIKEKGVLLTKKGKIDYTFQQIPETEVVYEGITYVLGSFQMKEKREEQMLSGRVLISRNTILNRIINLWKEEL